MYFLFFIVISTALEMTGWFGSVEMTLPVILSERSESKDLFEIDFSMRPPALVEMTEEFIMTATG